MADFAVIKARKIQFFSNGMVVAEMWPISGCKEFKPVHHHTSDP